VSGLTFSLPGCKIPSNVTVDLAAPLLEELEVAAAAAKLTLPAYVAEVLECHAASRRLPKIQSGGKPLGVLLRESSGEDKVAFPWPADTYRVYLTRGNAG
jgi:hypothetical protein